MSNRKGFCRTGSACSPVKKRKNGRPITPSMAQISREWKANKGNIQAKYKPTGNRTRWNNFIADRRKSGD